MILIGSSTNEGRTEDERSEILSFYLMRVCPCKFLMSGCRSYFYSRYRSEGGSYQEWTLWFHKNETMF